LGGSPAPRYRPPRLPLTASATKKPRDAALARPIGGCGPHVRKATMFRSQLRWFSMFVEDVARDNRQCDRMDRFLHIREDQISSRYEIQTRWRKPKAHRGHVGDFAIGLRASSQYWTSDTPNAPAAGPADHIMPAARRKMTVCTQSRPFIGLRAGADI
jgi:hypothetical protein